MEHRSSLALERVLLWLVCEEPFGALPREVVGDGLTCSALSILTEQTGGAMLQARGLRRKGLAVAERTLTDEESRFIEDFGMLFEERGATRMSGRIFGYLLICDPPYQTAGQITAALGVSKGSVSAMVRYLIQLGWIERFTLPGERSAFYRIRPDSPKDLFAMLLKGLVRMKEMTDRGLDLLPESRKDLRERCQILNDMYTHLENEFERLMHSLP